MNDDRLAILPWAGSVLIIGALLLALHGMRIDIRTPGFALTIQPHQETTR